MSRHKKYRPSLSSLYQWHRYLGLAVALLAALLAITGVMLNHTEQLALDQKQIQQRWLLNWYGISPVEGRFYRVGDHWLSQWGEQLYLDSNKLPFHFNETLSGAVALPEMIVTSGQQSLLLLTPGGQLIEHLDNLDGVPHGISAIATGNNGLLLVQTSEGIIAGELMTGEWQTVTGTATWSRSEAAPEALKQAISQHHPGATLPLERVILDLHSGRLFGGMGIYVMDAAAILLLFSAASGVLIWWRRKRQQQQRRHTPT
ncbi:MAG: PepSY domain-containing protein [Pseudomonadota bacterium]